MLERDNVFLSMSKEERSLVLDMAMKKLKEDEIKEQLIIIKRELEIINKKIIGCLDYEKINKLNEEQTKLTNQYVELIEQQLELFKQQTELSNELKKIFRR